MAARLTRSALAATAALALLLAGCGDDDDPVAIPDPAPPAAGPTPSEQASPAASAAAGEVTGSLSAEDQGGDGATFTVASVTIEGSDGWIALHADAEGAPGPVVGFVQVSEGESADVTVEAEEAVTSGDYWPMLHRDDGELGTYEFGETQGAQDAPVTDDDGEVVMQQVTYTVE